MPMKHPIIGFDLMGTLVPECGEFSCDPNRGLASFFYSHSIRQGTRELFRELHQSGYRVAVYTLSRDISALELSLWFRFLGVPVDRVIDREAHQKMCERTKQRSHSVKQPQNFGIELFFDDNEQSIAATRASGGSALLLTNRERDWTAPIRQACLSRPRQLVIAAGNM
jgi:hypothetical protein